LSSHIGAGDFPDRWFAQGIGVVQEVGEHHGTYQESRRRLLKATIDRKVQSFDLTPARTVPLSEFDCKGDGWQHYSSSDGSSFQDLSDCVAYSSKGR